MVAHDNWASTKKSHYDSWFKCCHLMNGNYYEPTSTTSTSIKLDSVVAHNKG